MNASAAAALPDIATDRCACLVCGSDNLEPVLDLGKTAPANNFLRPEDLASVTETAYPLRVALCRECGHVQLTDHVPPPVMFDHYLYMSSASSTLTGHLHGLAATITDRLSLMPDDLVIDVGCNDGTLLEGFGLAGTVRRLGIDPAANLAETARSKGSEVITAYLSPDRATEIRASHGPAKVVTMTNTFPHIPDLDGLVRAIDTLLAEDGALVLEAHYLVDLMEMGAFDTVYHEHVSYWALAPMTRLFADRGFEVFDVERLPIHHGQIRAWVCRAGQRQPSPNVTALLAREAELGLATPEPYRLLASRIGQMKSDLLGLMAEVRASGGRVAGYGAPAKGSTLLSTFGLGPADLDYIADRNTLKQGRLTPGSHIPIVAPEHIFKDRPDLVVVLAWNFAEEIADQLSAYVEAGGRLVVPVPELRDIGGPA